MFAGRENEEAEELVEGGGPARVIRAGGRVQRMRKRENVCVEGGMGGWVEAKEEVGSAVDQRARCLRAVAVGAAGFAAECCSVRTKEINADRDARRDRDRAPFRVECRARSVRMGQKQFNIVVLQSTLAGPLQSDGGMYYRPSSVSRLAGRLYFKTARRLGSDIRALRGGR